MLSTVQNREGECIRLNVNDMETMVPPKSCITYNTRDMHVHLCGYEKGL